MEESASPNYVAHVFVCTNQKKAGACCAQKNAENLRRVLKEWTRENPAWHKRIRINSSGCLDRCSEAVAIAVYPQNKWFTYVNEEDLPQLKAEIEKLMSTGL